MPEWRGKRIERARVRRLTDTTNQSLARRFIGFEVNSTGVQVLIDDTPAGDDVRITVLRGTATKRLTTKAVADTN